ncbi:MAG: 3,4-dihydroxy-2-butanone-4-phosphate synthase [Deltaproteobacteria bacterium]|nr:3,4-dihydroxy-2-butanone-4-phosphate synthase [Deltaproteobacteria bacterium]
MRTESIERVQKALAEVRAGRMVVLVDDEDRENEGDLVMAAACVTPEAVNFMVRHARGLVCLSLTEERVAHLDLPMMVDDNRSTRSTAFTISIEARHGVTTGISAADRCHTIQAAVAPDAHAHDLVSPGHVFPLKGCPGGVLQRTGHTEGSVDIARLAGFEPAGVICEIMRDDGSMARQKDLLEFSKEHGLSLVSIADLVEYRLAHERLVQLVQQEDVRLASGATWQAHVYEVKTDGRSFLALSYGELSGAPTLVRVHSGNILGDVFGVRPPAGGDLLDALEAIEAEGRGVVLYLPRLGNLAEDLAMHLGQPVERAQRPERGAVLREYGLGAQVLADLGLSQIRLLSRQSRRLPSLEGYGLDVIEQLPLRPGGSDTPPLAHSEQAPAAREIV